MFPTYVWGISSMYRHPLAATTFAILISAPELRSSNNWTRSDVTLGDVKYTHASELTDSAAVHAYLINAFGLEADVRAKASPLH